MMDGLRSRLQSTVEYPTLQSGVKTPNTKHYLFDFRILGIFILPLNFFQNLTLNLLYFGLVRLVHLGDDLLLELVDAADEEVLLFETHEHLAEVLVQQFGHEILVEILVEEAGFLEVNVELGDENRLEAVAEETAVVVIRDAGEVLGARLDLLALQGGEDLFEVVVDGLHGHGHGDRHRHRPNNDRLCILVEVDVASLDELEAVEEEVDALGVVAVDLSVDAILADADSSALVVLVDGREDRLVVVVDDGVGALLHVLLYVDLVDAARHSAERLLDPARVVADAGKGREKLLVGSVRLTLEVAEVQVASAAEQRKLALVFRVENFEARRLGDLVASRA